MQTLRDRKLERLWMGTLVTGLSLGVIGACSDSSDTGTGGSTSSSSTTGSSTTTSTHATSSTSTGATTSTTSSSSTGGAGGGTPECTQLAQGATHGDAIAISPDDATVVAVNRDVGTITVFSVDYTGGLPTLTKKAEIPVGGEPWQVAIDACGDSAYVVSRRDQKLIAIRDLKTTPTVGGSVAVGSEPTAVALSPNGSRVFVANWVDGTVLSFDPGTLSPKETIDLNGPLAATGDLGSGLTARPALAHPRSIAVTNNGDTSDTDEKVIVTEFFAQRTAPEAVDGSNADTNWTGFYYAIPVGGTAASVVPLGALATTGFGTGCFPNQLQSVTVQGSNAFVTSICASPKGPTGPKGMTYPVVHAIDVATGVATSAGPQNLAKVVDDLYATKITGGTDPTSPSLRYPLVANDIAFGNDGAAYVTANGVDAVFRVSFDATTGAVTPLTDFDYADLSSASIADPTLRGQNPIGIVAAHAKPFAFVANDVSRNVTAITFDQGSFGIAGGTAAPHVVASSDLPTDASELSRLLGKRSFNTGLGRWSLNGQGWGACQSCHFEGLSDGITWYFSKGQRQSPSLDGSFASADPSDQRVFNWTGVFDEIADFEGVARSIDGAVGAIVSTVSTPPVNADRIDLTLPTTGQPAGSSGLNGSAELLMQASSTLQSWDDVRSFIAAVRSPRAATNLDSAKVAAGKDLFTNAGKCQGCHGGPKWTVSQVFYAPGGATDEALKTKAWDGAALAASGFPAELLPASLTVNQLMRFSAAGGDQIQCVLRNVGTYKVSPAAIGVNELRQDMLTAGQGAAEGGNGFNVPSLLGLGVSAPYFHAGNARTLEELLTDTFQKHTQALTGSTNPIDTPAKVEALVAYLLSIDETTAPPALPTSAGADGGSFCASP